MAQRVRTSGWRSWVRRLLPLAFALVTVRVLTAVFHPSGTTMAWVVLGFILALFAVIGLVFTFGGDAHSRIQNIGTYFGREKRTDSTTPEQLGPPSTCLARNQRHHHQRPGGRTG